MTGLALSGMLALTGAASAQVVLDVTLDAPATYEEGGPVAITLTIDRNDGTAAPDSDVTAIGAEINLPAGWKLERDVDSNCDATISDNQVGGTNSTIQVKGANATYVDPPANTTCVDLPTTGNTLEVFWIPESGGTGDPLPVNFPIVVTATLVPSTCSQAANITATLRYRVGADPEVTPAPTGGDTTDCESTGCANPGDVTGGGVTPGDATAIFNFFLNPSNPPANAECADICGGGNGVTPGDATAAFKKFLNPSADPCV